MSPNTAVEVRRTRPGDFDGIVALSEAVYPGAPAWSREQLASHLAVFPEGQFVAVTPAGEVVGMAGSLVVLWDDYADAGTWRDFTAGGTFTNHDPAHGRTLYGAEVMVHPRTQGQGVGKELYAARRDLVRQLGLLRIRAGARLRGYHLVAGRLTAEEYAREVVFGRMTDPTLSFQLSQGFQVIGVVHDYLRHDPESLGKAALIEWLNPDVATPADAAAARSWLERTRTPTREA